MQYAVVTSRKVSFPSISRCKSREWYLLSIREDGDSTYLRCKFSDTNPNRSLRSAAAGAPVVPGLGTFARRIETALMRRRPILPRC